MNWREEYRRKLVSAEDAVSVVKSGDKVELATLGEPTALGLALTARKEELRDVEIYTAALYVDYGWYDPGWEDSFPINLDVYFGPFGRPPAAEKRADFSPRLYSLHFKPEDEGRPGVRRTEDLRRTPSPKELDPHWVAR